VSAPECQINVSVGWLSGRTKKIAALKVLAKKMHKNRTRLYGVMSLVLRDHFSDAAPIITSSPLLPTTDRKLIARCSRVQRPLSEVPTYAN
jgi:hypothetical protein